MKPTKIIELFIDDMEDESGIEAISLVGRPAHDENWIAFNKEQMTEEVDEFTPYEIKEEDFCDQNPALLQYGKPYGELEKDGWSIVRVDKMTPIEVWKMQKERFSNPNANSELDAGEYRIRFKYVGPRDELNRKFCADMLRSNRVYTIEDIDALTQEIANPDFGYYSIFLWRGSFNCRHQWVRLVYKKTGKINNSGSSTKGLIGTEGLGPELQPDTRTTDTIESAARGERADGSPSVQWRPGVPREGKFNNIGFKIDSNDVFDELEDACWEGYEPIGMKEKDGKMVPNCVPIEMALDLMKQEFQSYDDYPESAKNNACKAIRWKDEHGDEVKGMTQVGWIRANQLCKGEKISEETIGRMSGFQRHKKNSEVAPEFKDTPWKDSGYIAWLGWGGTSGIEWASSKLESIRNQSEKMMFYDEDKRVLVGAAMVPNKMIHRYDNLGNLYYVFFSKATIKRMADKFLLQKRTDETSIEHNGIKLGSDKVYITESWISDDPEKDKSANYGFNLPAGTWFVSMKVEDPKVWNLIKSKTLNGFSVEGLFQEKSIFSKQEQQINQIKEILKSIKDE